VAGAKSWASIIPWSKNKRESATLESAAGASHSTNAMVRKLLTKPTWWWETRRRYPVRDRYRELPPIPVVPRPSRFAVLTTPRSLADAMWTAWSWYRFLCAHGFELQLAVDGELSDGELTRVRALFPGISVYAVQSVYPDLCKLQPSLGSFLNQHPMGRKLGLSLALSLQGGVLCSDNDVLAFLPPDELLSCVERNIPAYFVEPLDGTRDPHIVARAKTMGLEYISRFNAGLLYIPRGAVSIELAAELLEDWQPPVDWFTEQTVQSVLMRKADAQPLPEDRYVVSARRQFYWETDEDYGKIAARHFVSPVRHVMYRYGIPLVLRQSKEFASPAPRRLPY